MKNLLLAGFADSYMLLIILVVVIVAFLLLSLSRRKKEESYRNELNSKIVPGAMVKTYSGLYGKVVSVTDTTDGKIVLLETGEGKKVSYQQIHINAIFGIDTKRELVFDENGNDITFADEDEADEVDVVEVDEEDGEEVVEVDAETENEETKADEKMKKRLKNNQKLLKSLQLLPKSQPKKQIAQKNQQKQKLMKNNWLINSYDFIKYGCQTYPYFF